MFVYRSMSRTSSPPKTVNKAPPGGLFGSIECADNKSHSPNNSSWDATGNDSRFGKHTNQLHPLHGYGYTHSEQPFPVTPQIYHQSPCHMILSLQATSRAYERFPNCGPPWQVYDLHQGGYGVSKIFHDPQFSGHGPSSPGMPRVPPGGSKNHPVNWPTSSSSTPAPQPPSIASGRHPRSLLTKR